MAQYTSPAIIGQGVSQGIQDARNIQAFSMQAAQMRAIQKQDVENQMPITLDKIKGIIPPDMHDATLNMAKSMGIVENVDGQDFIRKGKFQEFGDAIQKNSILKANLLEQTIHGLSAKQEPLLKEFQALKQDHDMRNADWEYKLQQLEKDAKENGSPIDMKKRDSIMKERNEFMGGDQVKKMSALGEQLSQLEELKMRRTQGLGVIDERYKKMASTIGEYAIPVMSGQMSYQEALRLVAIQKQQAEKPQEQWSDAYEKNIGGKKVLVQRNLLTNKEQKIDADKSTTIVVNPGQVTDQNGIDILADKLGRGLINSSDLSKRGGNQQIATIFKRAEELHPGFDPQGNKAENAAYQATLSQQTKQRGAVGSFVKNIGAQINTVYDIFKYLERTDARALNLPIRSLRTRLVGSGLENKYDMFLSEISAESSKLSQSAAQSIAQLPEGSREKWEKIHDLNLPIKEMKILLEGTKHMGEIRLKSLDDEIQYTKDHRKELKSGKLEQPPDSKDKLSSAVQYITDNANKYGQKELYARLKKAGWNDDDIKSAWRKYRGQ